MRILLNLKKLIFSYTAVARIFRHFQPIVILYYTHNHCNFPFGRYYIDDTTLLYLLIFFCRSILYFGIRFNHKILLGFFMNPLPQRPYRLPFRVLFSLRLIRKSSRIRDRPTLYAQGRIYCMYILISIELTI